MTDPTRLRSLLGQWVTVTNPHRPASWHGKLIGLADDPSVILQTPTGQQACLPQSFTIEPAEEPPPPPPNDLAAQVDLFTKQAAELRDLRAQLKASKQRECDALCRDAQDDRDDLQRKLTEAQNELAALRIEHGHLREQLIRTSQRAHRWWNAWRSARARALTHADQRDAWRHLARQDGPTDDTCVRHADLLAGIGYPVRCPHCPPDATPIPPTHWTKHIQRHHPETPMPEPTPAEHCGDVVDLPVSGGTTECILRPGHSGSHADENGTRWRRHTPAPTTADLRGQVAESIATWADHDSADIFQAVTAVLRVPAIAEALTAVDRMRALHQPVKDWSWNIFGCKHDGKHDQLCACCRTCYPCPTLAVLDPQGPS